MAAWQSAVYFRLVRGRREALARPPTMSATLGEPTSPPMPPPPSASPGSPVPLVDGVVVEQQMPLDSLPLSHT